MSSKDRRTTIAIAPNITIVETSIKNQAAISTIEDINEA